MGIKRYFKVVLFMVLGIPMLFSQLPDGSIGADWTLTDLDGNTHTLYDYLDNGKTVVIDFSATWCPPCWSYHNSGVLETLWEDYGPDGTDEIMVFFIEADLSTGEDCLYGLPSCPGSMGDWVTGTSYPIINLQSADAQVKVDYQISYYPTLYVVCADNKKTYEVGQGSVSTWEGWIFGSCPMDASYLVEDAICYGEGAIDLTTEDGYGNIWYSWSNGETTEDLSDIGAGLYSVTITDTHGHSIEKEDIEVGGVEEPLEAVLEDLNNTMCAGESGGSITVSGFNGTGPFTYSWSNGETGATIDDLMAGDYDVTVTDANNCTGYGGPFTISEPEPLDLVVELVHTSCGLDNGEISMQGLGGTGTEYQFDIGWGYDYDDHYYNLFSGWYTIGVMDENGCEFFIDEFIEDSQMPVADAGDDMEIDCAITEVTLDGSGSSDYSGLDYYWSTPDGNIVSGYNTLYPVVDAEGTYSLSVYDYNGDCEAFDEVIVVSMAEPPGLEIATPDVLTCELLLITLDASNSDSGDDFTILWTTENGNIVEGESTLTPDVDAVGTYTLTITNDLNGCSSSMDIEVTEDVVLPAFETDDAVITCTDTEVEICVVPQSNVDHVVWSDGTQGLCRTASEAGMYGFTAFGTNGCTLSGEAEVVADASLPTAEAGDDQTLTCTISSVLLDGSGSSSGEDFTYEWTDAEGNLLGTEATLEVTQTGTYALEVTNVTNGCSNTDQVVVDEHINTPDPAFTHEVDYNVINLTSTSNGSNETSSWTSSDGQTADGFTASFTYLQSGDYEVCHSITNECGTETNCQTISVTILPLAFDATVINITCPGGQDGMISVVPGGGVSDYEISWEGPDGFASGDFEIIDLAEGSYGMLLSDQAGNTLEETFVVNMPEAFNASYEVTDEIDDNSNGAIDMTITGGTPPYAFNWSNGAHEEDIQGLAAGDYTLDVTDANGCVFTVTVTVDMRTNSVDLPFVELFSVSPVPTFNTINIDIAFEKQLKGKLILINKLGQAVDTKELTGSQKLTMDVSALQAGIYFLRLETKDGSVSRKILKL